MLIAHAEAVTAPLPRWRRAEVVEQIKNSDPRMKAGHRPVHSWHALGFGRGSCSGAGGFWGHDTAQITVMQDQIVGLTRQVAELGEKIGNAPRVDQIQQLADDLGAAAGRLDAFDARLRTVEAGQASMSATLQGIDQASRAALPRRP